MRKRNLRSHKMGGKFCKFLAAMLFCCAPGGAVPQADSTTGAYATPGGELSGVDLSGDLPPDPVISADDDSVQLRLMEIESERYRIEADHTNLWHRLIPAVHFSASVGWKDILVLDPSTLAPSTLPKDALRLTIGVSLNEILDGSRHSAAELGLKRVQALRERILALRRRSRIDLDLELKKLSVETAAVREERDVAEGVLRFNEMRFQHGKIEYDAFMRSKVQLIDVNKRLKLLTQQAEDVQRRLSGGGGR